VTIAFATAIAPVWLSNGPAPSPAIVKVAKARRASGDTGESVMAISGTPRSATRAALSSNATS